MFPPLSKANESILIANQKGYVILPSGSILSPRRNTLCLIKINKGTKGTTHSIYYAFNISYKGKPRTVLVHKYQAYQKFGDKIFEPGIVVRHLNGNSLDNSWDNIAIGTMQDNMLDIPQEKRKTMAQKGLEVANKAAIAKTRTLTVEQVIKIRTMYSNGLTAMRISKNMQIPYDSVHRIVHNKSYTESCYHVSTSS